MARAVALASRLVESEGRVVCRGGTELAIDVAAMGRTIERRLDDAAEMLVAPRRGRPPGGNSRNTQR